MDFRRMRESWEEYYLSKVEMGNSCKDDECDCQQCMLPEMYMNKQILMSSEKEPYQWEEWLKESEDTELTSEELEYVTNINSGIGFTDEELEELERLFGNGGAKPKTKEDEEKEKREKEIWDQWHCEHPKESVIINEAGGTKFKYCKKCKKDLGDVV